MLRRVFTWNTQVTERKWSGMAKFDLMATWGRFWRFLVVEPCVVARPASRHRKGSCFGELLANFSPRPGPYFAAGKSLKTDF